MGQGGQGVGLLKRGGSIRPSTEYGGPRSARKHFNISQFNSHVFKHVAIGALARCDIGKQNDSRPGNPVCARGRAGARGHEPSCRFNTRNYTLADAVCRGLSGTTASRRYFPERQKQSQCACFQTFLRSSKTCRSTVPTNHKSSHSHHKQQPSHISSNRPGCLCSFRHMILLPDLNLIVVCLVLTAAVFSCKQDFSSSKGAPCMRVIGVSPHKMPSC